MQERTLTARWVFPGTGPPLEQGTVTLSDTIILGVHAHGERTADLDLGNVAIIPGLVNAHTHLDLSGAHGLTPPTHEFTTWLRNVIAFRRSRTPEQVQADIREGVSQLLETGTTLVGDITVGAASWDTLLNAPLRAVVFDELIGLDESKLAERWPRRRSRFGDVPLGVESARTIHGSWSKRRIRSGKPNRSLPHTSPKRSMNWELLEHRRGPFVEFLTAANVYLPANLATSWGAFLGDNTASYSQQRLIVHGNYLPHNFAFRSGDSVVYCPRTHDAFRHAPHPFREFLARGVCVALGTDSLASNPDLNLFAEAQWIHAHYPDFSGELLLRMATNFGATALGYSDITGSLEVGKVADLALVDLPNADGEENPYALLWSPCSCVRRFR